MVEKGYSYIEGFDFGDIFSLIASFGLEVEKMDGKTLFLHGDLDEEIYMKQLEGFIVKESLYSLK